MTKSDYLHTETGGAPIKSWTHGVPVDELTWRQLRNVAALPFVHRHVVAMPDVHLGLGATVGSVIPTRGAVVPAAVGVDIGCGMMAVRTALRAGDLPDNLAGVRAAIERRVPHGRTDNGGENDRGAWVEPPEKVKEAWQSSGSGQGASLAAGLNEIVERAPRLSRAARRGAAHLGTLGTGNHFIEICLDEEDGVWAMLHSGSRGIGNAIGRHFIELAKKDMRRWFIDLPDKDLAYMPEGSEHFGAYMRAVGWAQKYARINREMMMECVLEVLAEEVRPTEAIEMAVNCHHNYISRETHFGADIWVTRKGAVRARKGEFGIVPGSMGARSFIVRGKGNAASLDSCSHGAGRVMSRGEARRRFSVDDHKAATVGVECRKDDGVIDETPGAYKDIDAVMAAQESLVEVVHTLKQVVCVKG